MADVRMHNQQEPRTRVVAKAIRPNPEETNGGTLLAIWEGLEGQTAGEVLQNLMQYLGSCKFKIVGDYDIQIRHVPVPQLTGQVSEKQIEGSGVEQRLQQHLWNDNEELTKIEAGNIAKSILQFFDVVPKKPVIKTRRQRALEAASAVMREHFGTSWSAEATLRHPNSSCSKRISAIADALEDFVDSEKVKR